MANFENQRRSLGAPSLSRPPLRGPRGERGPAGPSGVSGITPPGVGAQFATFSRREQNVVYVTDFMSTAEQADCFNCARTLDLQPAIQKAIDFALYNNSTGRSGGPRVRLPGGVLRIDRPIQLGYGIDLRSVTLEGEGIRYGGTFGAAGSGSALVATFRDAPAIAVQGLWFGQIRNLSIFGPNATYVFHTILEFGHATMADLDVSHWVDPACPASASARYSVQCGIAIDPYSGTQPGVHYPAVAYPSFLGTVPQYGKSFSSNLLVENVYIEGFVAGIALQPCPADGNGDFMRFENVSLFFCAYAFVWGNSQARVNTLNSCNILGCHTALDNVTFGLTAGNGQIEVRGASFNEVIQIANLDTQNGGGPLFQHCFAEDLYKIGTIGVSADQAAAAKFDDCVFGFSWWTFYGVPTYVFMNGARSCMATFRQCHFYAAGFISDPGAWVPLVFFTGGLVDAGLQYRFEDCDVQWQTHPTQAWEQCAVNATGGLFFGRGTTGLEAYSGNRAWRTFDLDTGASLDVGLYGSSNMGTRNRCLPAYGKRARSNRFGADPGVPMALRIGGITAAGAVTQSGRNITFTVTGYTADTATHSGGEPGDVLWCEQTQASFIVYARTGTTVSARCTAGFDVNGNLLAAIPNGAFFWGLNCRRYCPGPEVAIYGDLTAGSPTITNVVNGSGAALDASPYVTVGDWLAQEHEVDKLFATANFIDPKVTAIASGSMTMNANAVRTATHLRLGLFTRAAVANGTATP